MARHRLGPCQPLTNPLQRLGVLSPVVALHHIVELSQRAKADSSKGFLYFSNLFYLIGSTSAAGREKALLTGGA